MRRALATFAFGCLFGFLLSRVHATHYDVIANMFLLRDLYLAGVISVAIAVAGVGFAIMKRRGSLVGVQTAKPGKPGNVVGGLLFGAGWALTGTCPGTALAQIGNGIWMGLFTVVGILLGTLLYRKLGAATEGWLRQASSKPGKRVARPSDSGITPAET